MLQSVPRSWGELFAMLAALGAAIGTGKLLASKQRFTWRRLLNATLAGAGLAAAGVVPLFWFPDANPVAAIGLGVLLATLGLGGIQKLLKTWRGRK